MDDKTKAIVAHITLIGWIVALIMNNQDKGTLTSFYIRQMLGLMLTGFVCSFVLGFIPIIGWIASIFITFALIALWIISLINAINGKENPLPVVGALYQDWFKGL